MKKNLIVFDIDGTLTDSVKQHITAFREVLGEIGVRDVDADFKSFKHHTDSFIAKEIFETDRQAEFSEEKKIQFEAGLTDRLDKHQFSEIPGAKQLLENLTSSDFGICFATGSLRRPAKHKLISIGVEFEEWQLVTSDDLYSREEIVRKAIDQAKTNYDVQQFERIISIGDGIWDLFTARNLELEFIGVGEENRTKLIENGAKAVFTDLTALNFNDGVRYSV